MVGDTRIRGFLLRRRPVYFGGVPDCDPDGAVLMILCWVFDRVVVLLTLAMATHFFEAASQTWPVWQVFAGWTVTLPVFDLLAL